MEERIKYLFRQYTTGKCSRKEYEEFFVYVRQSAHDATIRAMVQEAYASTAGATATPPYVDGNGELVLPARPKKTRLRWSMAAAAVLMLGFLLWWNTGPKLTRNFTARSEFKYLQLPDGTQVWLNAASTLEYPPEFGENTTREVYLSGEAYFDVQHAAQVPFVIHTGDVSTTVLGTAFNIKAYPGLKNIIVSVNRGKVSVNYGQQKATTLTGGQQLKVDREVAAPTVIKTVIAEAAPWKLGDLAYDNETLEDIVKDLERVYNVSISIHEAGIRQVKISTSFRREIGVEKALEVLCRLTDKGLTRTEGIYIIQ